MPETQTAPVPTAAAPPETASGKVSIGRKFAYGISGMTDCIIQNSLVGLSLPIYNKGMGLSPELIGWAIAIPRVFDAIVDPFIGNASDNTRSPWGRRRPFMFVASFLMAITFALIWMPPASLYKTPFTTLFTLPGLFWFFMIAGIFYYVAYALFAIPRGALGIEMTTDPAERTSLFAYMSFFGYVASVLLLPWLYKLAFVFNPTDEVKGMRGVAVSCSIILLICSILPAILCRERDEKIDQPKIKLLTTIRTTVTNGPFLILAAMVLIVLLGVMFSNPMGLYINIDYICGGDKERGATYGAIAGTVTGIVSIISIPIVTYLTRRIGKRRTIMVSLTVSMFGFLISWFTFTPAHPYWQMIPAAIYCAGLTSVWVLGGPLIADICDLDELTHGLRREGIFGAANQFLVKAGTALIAVVSGYAINWAGYQEGLKVQSALTITKMRVAYIVIPIACLAVAILLTWLLPITEASAREVRTQLDARKRQKETEANTPLG